MLDIDTKNQFAPTCINDKSGCGITKFYYCFELSDTLNLY